MGHLQVRAVRALGVFRDSRFEALPDVPTMKEQGINAHLPDVARRRDAEGRA